MVYYGMNNKAYSLEQQEIAHGGEGAVYGIINDNTIVAKIFLKPTKERKNKIITMVEQTSKSSVCNYYAWPTDILYDNAGSFVGFIMPRLSNGKSDLKKEYLFDNRKTTKWGKYLQMAINLSIAVANAHEEGIIIGDLNADNIKVDINDATITLIDTDSYHIKDKKTGQLYPCIVCKPEFTAPEILNAGDISKLTPDKSFSKETDNYALAILIYRILMNGVHPFQFKFLTPGLTVPRLEDNMNNAICAQFMKSYNGESIDIPPQAPNIMHFPSEIQDLFHKAFIEGCHNPSVRPSAEEWYKALKTLQQKLNICDVDPTHEHCSEISCPWCEVEHKMSSVNITAAKQKTKLASQFKNISQQNNSKKNNNTNNPSYQSNNNQHTTPSSNNTTNTYSNQPSSSPSTTPQKKYNTSYNSYNSNKSSSNGFGCLAIMVVIIILIIFGISRLFVNKSEKESTQTEVFNEQDMFYDPAYDNLNPVTTTVTQAINGQKVQITINKNTISVNDCSFDEIDQFEQYIVTNYAAGTKFIISTNHAVVDVHEQVKQILDDLGFDYKE